ncbi:helix-turn-helix transcriptional regulator [Oxalobacteraceae bacterium]|nr:helix-turn-helix transcriptional regulator [Oxalobacteraceae bacterium]
MELMRLDFNNPAAREVILGEGTVRSSAEYGWDALYFEHREGDSFETVEHVMDGHYLMVKLNPMSRAERRLDGKTQLEIQRRGAVAYIPNGCMHRVRYLTPLGGLLLLTLPSETIDQVAGELGVDQFRGVPAFADNEDPFVLAAAEALDRELADGNPHGALFAQTYAKVLAAHIVTRHRYPKSKSGRLPALSPAKLRWLDQYIESTLSHPISLAELAHQVGLSEYHFCRVFKGATGMSPYNYVLRKRIEFARLCLAADHTSIQDVAFMTGFGDPIQFAKQFKRLSGMTPSAYRLSCKKTPPSTYTPLFDI